MPIYLEDIVDVILSEEGMFLLGMPFIEDTLGLTMKKMESIFIRCAAEYSRKKPIQLSGHFSGSPIIQMPANTLGIKSLRYGVLQEYPATFQLRFDMINYQYFPHNKQLKVFPPVTPLKVDYFASLTVSNRTKVIEDINVFEGQDEIDEILKNSFVKGTIVFKKLNKTMVEISRADVTSVDNDENNITETIVTLGGTLGTGTINLSTREYHLELLDTSIGDIQIEYYSKYKYIEEIDIGDFVFYKLFAYNLLKSIATLRAQISQDSLHNIDLTNDNLLERVGVLGREVRDMLKSNMSFSSLLGI